MCVKSQLGSYVEEWELHVHPLDGHKKLFAIMQAYFDESGIDQASEYCVLAGYVGGIGQWRRFERAWKKLLSRYQVKEFHAKRFFQRDDKGERLDEYKKWTDAKADTFIRELIYSITSVKVYPVSCTVVKADWDKLTYGERRFLTGGTFDEGNFITSGAPSKAYFAPYCFCIYMATDFCGLGQKVHFAFDLNKDLHGYSREYFKHLKNLKTLPWREKLGQPSWPTSLEAVQLQAADLLAYLLFEFMPSRIGNPLAKPNSLLRLAAGRQWPNTMKFLDTAGLDLLFTGCSREEMKAIQPPKQLHKRKAHHMCGLA